MQLGTVRLVVACVGSKKLPVPTTTAVMLLPIPTPAMRRFKTFIFVSLVRGMVSLLPPYLAILISARNGLVYGWRSA